MKNKHLFYIDSLHSKFRKKNSNESTLANCLRSIPKSRINSQPDINVLKPVCDGDELKDVLLQEPCIDNTALDEESDADRISKSVAVECIQESPIEDEEEYVKHPVRTLKTDVPSPSSPSESFGPFTDCKYYEKSHVKSEHDSDEEHHQQASATIDSGAEWDHSIASADITEQLVVEPVSEMVIKTHLTETTCTGPGFEDINCNDNYGSKTHIPDACSASSASQSTLTSDTGEESNSGELSGLSTSVQLSTHPTSAITESNPAIRGVHVCSKEITKDSNPSVCPSFETHLAEDCNEHLPQLVKNDENTSDDIARQTEPVALNDEMGESCVNDGITAQKPHDNVPNTGSIYTPSSGGIEQDIIGSDYEHRLFALNGQTKLYALRTGRGKNYLGNSLTIQDAPFVPQRDFPTKKFRGLSGRALSKSATSTRSKSRLPKTIRSSSAMTTNAILEALPPSIQPPETSHSSVKSKKNMSHETSNDKDISSVVLKYTCEPIPKPPLHITHLEMHRPLPSHTLSQTNDYANSPVGLRHYIASSGDSGVTSNTFQTKKHNAGPSLDRERVIIPEWLKYLKRSMVSKTHN